MSEPDIDPHHGIPLVNTAIDDPLDGVSDPPSSSLSPQEMNFPGNDFSPMPRHPPSGPSGTARYKSWKCDTTFLLPTGQHVWCRNTY